MNRRNSQNLLKEMHCRDVQTTHLRHRRKILEVIAPSAFTVILARCAVDHAAPLELLAFLPVSPEVFDLKTG